MKELLERLLVEGEQEVLNKIAMERDFPEGWRGHVVKHERRGDVAEFSWDVGKYQVRFEVAYPYIANGFVSVQGDRIESIEKASLVGNDKKEVGGVIRELLVKYGG